MDDPLTFNDFIDTTSADVDIGFDGSYKIDWHSKSEIFSFVYNHGVCDPLHNCDSSIEEDKINGWASYNPQLQEASIVLSDDKYTQSTFILTSVDGIYVRVVFKNDKLKLSLRDPMTMWNDLELTTDEALKG